MSEPLIISDPAVMMGKPVVAGTRVTVELILEKAAAGESVEQILAAHPRLTRPDVLAAFAFATRVLRPDQDDQDGGAGSATQSARSIWRCP